MAVDPIITDLHYVMETSQELDILNFHKGFPITCKARVETIDHDKVMLLVQPPGSVCLESQEQTIVLSRGLPEAVRARVMDFDLVGGKLTLSDFSYVGSHFGERMIARVQPEDTIAVEIEASERKTTGTLVDVSLSGIGVYTSESDYQRGQVLEITLPLPEGRVTNVNQTPEGKVRLSIGFTRNAQEIAVVMRYIKDRRSEILGEIEHKYEQAYHDQIEKKKVNKND
jgi:hypothetical protein